MRENEKQQLYLRKSWRYSQLCEYTFRNQEGTVNCFTVPFGFRKVKCKTQVSNRPQNTLRKFYRVFTADSGFCAPCSSSNCTIFLPTSRLDCLNSGKHILFIFSTNITSQTLYIVRLKEAHSFSFCLRMLSPYEKENDNQPRQGAIKTANWNLSFGFTHNTIVLHKHPIDAKC
jgi:hypothetical protein